MMDQDGNQLKDGEWLAMAVNGMIRGQIAWVNDGGLTLANNQPSPAFINLVIQVPCPPNTGGRIPNVSKIFGPNEGVQRDK